ncbi:HAD domain-containing protein [Hamadaea tsunoensis]|uniref:hypothetical protein n=1 Tax=Hamadaea tsunoensis TaxID=53368 RepID=UPI00040F0DD2|nr:hypothetical protein [Hamadaea tsunoensis]
MPRPPVWLLDVDGVINTRRPVWGPDLSRGTVHSDGEDYPLRWAPRLIARIRRLHETGIVDVAWCTTWCPDAGALEQLFGLPPLGIALDAEALAGDSDSAKLAAARRVRASGRRLVWTDDTAIPDEAPVRRELTERGMGLLIRPHPRRGLRPGDVDRIEWFARAPRREWIISRSWDRS